MADTPRLIRDFSEIAARTDFDAEAPCTRDNFASIVVPYRFPDDDLRPCQVHKPDVHRPDGRCGQMHFNGWLTKLKDGRTVLVGSSCGPKYFNAHETFNVETRRIQREVDITDFMDRLGELLGNRDAFDSEVGAAFARLRAITHARTKLLRNLPGRVQRRLEDMARTGNSRVLLQIQYVETDEKGKKHYEWIDQPLGTVLGTEICRTDRAQDASNKLSEMRHALDDVVLDRDAGYRKLKKWLGALSQMPSITPVIEELEKQYRQFATPENISLLIYVDANRDVQRDVAQVVLAMRGQDRPTEDQLEAFLRERDNAIRDANGGRNWRTHR